MIIDKEAFVTAFVACRMAASPVLDAEAALWAAEKAWKALAAAMAAMEPDIYCRCPRPASATTSDRGTPYCTRCGIDMAPEGA